MSMLIILSAFTASAAGIVSHICGCSILTTVLFTLLFAYLPSFSDGSEYHGRRKWDSFCRHPMWETVCGYFSGRVIPPKKAGALDKKGQYIFCQFPHGVMSINHGMTMTNGCGFLSDIHDGPRRELAATVCFRIPFYREILLWWGCVDAGVKTASRVLAEKKSLCILVGGEKEQLFTQPGKHRVVCKTRKGFVKLALRHGVPLVPVYAFGENELYRTSPFLFPLRHTIMRKLRICIPLATGPYPLPFLLSWVPFKKRLTVVVGEPIAVEKWSYGGGSGSGSGRGGDSSGNNSNNGNGGSGNSSSGESGSGESESRKKEGKEEKEEKEAFAAAVDRVHLRFMQALESLFEEHKEACGWPPTSQLEFI